VDPRHIDGLSCELFLMHFLTEKGYYVFTPISPHSPVDVVAIDNKGKTYLFDSKKEARRVNPGRKNSDRIHRLRSKLQKDMGVRMAYVDIAAEKVHIVPPLED
tara:strand:+ start:750 stop:1058 length:309 start_codon:yes stop_codon:yes gene_type:complete